MTTMGAGTALRVAHTAVLVAVCVVVSGLGHDLASGTSPTLRSYLLALVPMTLLAWRLARRERSAATVIGASAAAQLMLHTLFGLAHGPDPTAAHGAHTGHRMSVVTSGEHGGTAATDAGDAVLRALGSLFDPAALTSGMAGAHALAGVVCGWWLWRGERSLAQLGRALALFLGGLLPRFVAMTLGGAHALPMTTPWPTDHRGSDRLPTPLALLRATPRRGPPSFAS
ncbi:hypothetical protein JNUCC64_31185 [Streptomyces sp. JNUCC 64]